MSFFNKVTSFFGYGNQAEKPEKKKKGEKKKSRGRSFEESSRDGQGSSTTDISQTSRNRSESASLSPDHHATPSGWGQSGSSGYQSAAGPQEHPSHFHERPVDVGSIEHHNTQSLTSSDEHSGATARDASSLPMPENQRRVWYAIDRSRKDWLLKTAIEFVREETNIMLEQAPDLASAKPLLLFCKNDTKLQEDIDNAFRINRGRLLHQGLNREDVMLIVVTDKKEQVLKDTKATEVFGQKVCLYWDHGKKKFRYSDNHKPMMWIKDFLVQFNIKVNVHFKRTDSLRRSITKATEGEASGCYHVVSDYLEEEALKNAVIHFNKLLVDLQRVHKPPFPRPLILFCVPKDNPDRAVAEFMDRHKFGPRDLHIVVLCRVSKLEIYGQGPGLPPFFRLRMHDLWPILEEDASSQNNTVVTAIKRFLKKNPLKYEDQKREGKTSIPDQETQEPSAERDLQSSPCAMPLEFNTLTLPDAAGAASSGQIYETDPRYHSSSQQQQFDSRTRGGVGYFGELPTSPVYASVSDPFHKVSGSNRMVKGVQEEHIGFSDQEHHRYDQYYYSEQQRKEGSAQIQQAHHHRYPNTAGTSVSIDARRESGNIGQDMYSRNQTEEGMDFEDSYRGSQNGVQEASWQGHRPPQARDALSMVNTDGGRRDGVVPPTGSTRRKQRQRARLHLDQGGEETEQRPAEKRKTDMDDLADLMGGMHLEGKYRKVEEEPVKLVVEDRPRPIKTRRKTGRRPKR